MELKITGLFWARRINAGEGRFLTTTPGEIRWSGTNWIGFWISDTISSGTPSKLIAKNHWHGTYFFHVIKSTFVFMIVSLPFLEVDQSPIQHQIEPFRVCVYYTKRSSRMYGWFNLYDINNVENWSAHGILAEMLQIMSNGIVFTQILVTLPILQAAA